MTYKSAMAGLPLGGGKAVIIGDAKKIKSEELFRAYGRFIESLSGRYITAEDVNIRTEDIDIVAKETSHVAGTADKAGDLSTHSFGHLPGLKSGSKTPFRQRRLKRRKNCCARFRLGRL